MLSMYRNTLTGVQWHYAVEKERNMNINSYSGLNDNSSNILNNLLQLRNTDKILEFIDEQKYMLSKSKQRSQQAYTMLLIVEQIVRNFARWSTSQDKSELTIYRRLASLFDILLDSTSIEMIDGENTCEATKLSMNMNKSLFGLGDQSSSYGRKIDLMLGITHEKKKVEVSSNEWKRNAVSQEVIQKQQCKNLRTNACIIQQLMSRCKIDTSVMAMDFVGNCGCLYMMKKTQQEQVFIAKPVARLVIPYHVDHISALKPTLNAFFQMKSFLVEQKRSINETMFELDVDNTLSSMNLTSLSTASTIPASSYIFWETKRKNEPSQN